MVDPLYFSPPSNPREAILQPKPDERFTPSIDIDASKKIWTGQTESQSPPLKPERMRWLNEHTSRISALFFKATDRALEKCKSAKEIFAPAIMTLLEGITEEQKTEELIRLAHALLSRKQELPELISSQVAPFIDLLREKEANRNELDQVSGSSTMSALAKAFAEDICHLLLTEPKRPAASDTWHDHLIADLSKEAQAQLRQYLETNKRMETLVDAMEAVFIKNFIRIAKKNPPTESKDSLVALTSRLLQFVNEHYLQITEGNDDMAKNLLKDIFDINSSTAIDGVPPVLQPVIYDLLVKHMVNKIEAGKREQEELHLTNRDALEQSSELAKKTVPLMAHAIGEGVADEISRQFSKGEAQNRLKARAAAYLAKNTLELATITRQFSLAGPIIAEATCFAATPATRMQIAMTVEEIAVLPLTRVVNKLVKAEIENPALIHTLVTDIVTIAADHFEGKPASHRLPTQQILSLLYPGGARDLPVPKELREAVWRQLQETLPELLSQIIRELTTEEKMREFLMIGLESATAALKPSSTKKERRVASTSDAANAELDMQLERLTFALLKGAGILETKIGKALLVPGSGKVKPEIQKMIGEAVRKQLHTTFIQERIEAVCDNLIARQKKSIKTKRAAAELDRETKDLMENLVNQYVDKYFGKKKQTTEKTIFGPVFGRVVGTMIKPILRSYAREHSEKLFRYLTQPTTDGQSHMTTLAKKIAEALTS